MSKRITDLTELTSPSGDDWIEVVDISETNINLKNKKVKASNLVGGSVAVLDGYFNDFSFSVTYVGGTTYYVLYNGLIYKFIKATDSTGETPSANPTVWELTPSGSFAHERNKDEYLDYGGLNQVAASDIFKKTGEVAMTGHADWGGKNITNFGTLYSGNTNVIVNTTNANNYLQVASGGVVLNSNGEVTVQAAALNVTTGTYKASLKSDLAGSDVVHQLPATSGTLALFSDITASNVGNTSAQWNANKLLGNAIPSDAVGYLYNDGSGNLTWAAASGGSSTYAGLTDVSLTSISDAQFSQYHSATSKWENISISGDITIDNTGVAAIGSGKVTNSMLAGSIDYAKMDSATSASVKSFAITGTGGDGYGEFIAQSSNPSAPTGGCRQFANSSGRLSWIPQADGFVRSFSGTLTANRTYSWPDQDITVAGVGIDTYYTVKISISSAELLSLFTTPKQLLPAPGSGITYDIVKIYGRLNFVTSAYSSGTLNIGFGTTGISSALANNSQLLSSNPSRTQQFLFLVNVSSAIDQFRTNTPLIIQAQSSDPTSGAGSMDIYVVYKTLTL